MGYLETISRDIKSRRNTNLRIYLDQKIMAYGIVNHHPTPRKIGSLSENVWLVCDSREGEGEGGGVFQTSS